MIARKEMTAIFVLYSQMPHTVVRPPWDLMGDLGFAPTPLWLEANTIFDSCEPRTN